MELQAAPNKLWLAPLKGFTDAVFRRAYARHFEGFDAAVAPFITAAPADRLTENHVRDILPDGNGRIPLVPQILGSTAEDFIHLARRCHELGYPEVNWNLGCPFRPVAKKLRGAGLLPFPEKVDEFLDKVMRALPGRLSIKMRLGRYAAGEIFRLLPVLDRYPLAMLIIHPRTGKQMYEGLPDLAAFEACLEASRHRLVYNGDIASLEGFRALSARFPRIDAWMIGRGALSDPFLPADIKCGRARAGGRLEAFRAFYEELFAGYRERLSGPGHLLGRMKGFWKYFSGAFENGAAIEKRVHRISKLPHYVDAVDRFLSREALWRGSASGPTS
jgi:tRNA-dihydrouridine synthase